MGRFITGIIGLVLVIFLFLVVGNVVLEEFPQVQPLWEELRQHVVNLYNMSIVKYGAMTTFLIIIAIFIVLGSSRRI